MTFLIIAYVVALLLVLAFFKGASLVSSDRYQTVQGDGLRPRQRPEMNAAEQLELLPVTSFPQSVTGRRKGSG